jgi:Heparinase II/III-like protein/Heparinase II/III N-terminus
MGISHLTRVPSARELRSLFTSEVRAITATPESLLNHFRTRTTPQFFPAFADAPATSTVLLDRFAPNTTLIEKSERILSGCFDLLGLTNLNFGCPINWHLEPVAGTIAPRLHWSQIDYLDPTKTGDKKITWELNRHQYFAILGRTYWKTGDERYAQAFSDHVLSWIEQNPPKIGLNWASSLEVGFRTISWLWALYFFRNSASFTPSLLQSILKLLYVHALHLQNYLSTYFSPNTHLTGEALALFYLGLLLPEFHAANTWRSLGEELLLSQLDRHVLEDGVYFEQSTYYHRYTADFYLHFLILLEANEQKVAPELRIKLTKLLDHLLYITRPDGTTPLIGDDDGGRLMQLDDRALDDFRTTLATAAVAFRRSDYKFVSGEATEETLWLLGPQGLQTYDQLTSQTPKEMSCSFSRGGYYVMRDSWSASANYMLIDSGPLGGLRYGHAHADALSFDLTARGRTLLVDPGTFTYTNSKEDRDYFRSSIAHNTLTVDGVSSSVPAGPFAWSHVANATVLNWMSKDRFDFFSGSHDGYECLEPPVTHRRDVLFLKDDYWLLVDHLQGYGEHRYEMPFHFVESAHPAAIDASNWKYITERSVEGPGLDIAICLETGTWENCQGWVSHTYRQRAPAPLIILKFKASNRRVVSLLIPRTGAESRPEIETVETSSGFAFEVTEDGLRDLIMIGPAQTTADKIASDFEVAWLRFRASSVLQELVLINGQDLRFDNTSFVRFERKVQYLTASIRDGELQGEIDGSEWRHSRHEPHSTTVG